MYYICTTITEVANSDKHTLRVFYYLWLATTCTGMVFYMFTASLIVIINAINMANSCKTGVYTECIK